MIEILLRIFRHLESFFGNYLYTIDFRQEIIEFIELK